MSRRTYLLISRSSLVLIVLLVAAPVVDFYRFGRFVPGGGAGLPIGAILPAARGASAIAADPAPEAKPPAPPVAKEAPAVTEQKQVSPPPEAPTQAAKFRPPAKRPAATARNEFEAWTAWGQIDPFWDGYDRPPRARAAGGTETPAADADPGGSGAGTIADRAGSEGSEAAPQDGKRGAAQHGRSAVVADEPKVETPEGDEPMEGGTEGPGSHAAPPVDGWIIGRPPGNAGGSEDTRLAPGTTRPLPEPAPAGGGVSPSLPREPRPRPVLFPTARIDSPATPVDIGQQFDVVVRVDSVDQMTSLPFHLMFDAGLLAFVSAQTGPALGALQPVLLASVNPNRPGDLAVGLSLIESAGTFSGTGDLIVLRFQAIASGRSDLLFANATLRGAASEPIDTRFTGGSVLVR